MTIRHLQTFIAVCDCGGATRAAEFLHIAQPAVSRTVAELEKYYGVPLFTREDKKLVPTDAGRRLLAKAREAVAAFEDFESFASAQSETAVFNMGATLTIGKLYVPAMLAAAEKSAACAIVYAQICRASRIEEMLLGGELDFAFSEGQVFAAGLCAHAVAEDKLIAVCGENYSGGDVMDIDGLADCRLLLREKGSASRDMLDGIFAERGLGVTPRIQSVSNEALIAAAEEGLGVAVLPQKLVAPHIASGRLKAVRVEGIDFRRRYCFVYRRDKKFTPVLRQIVTVCAAAFG